MVARLKKEEVQRYLNLPSRGMREVVDLVERVAPLNTTVFINGPSGSGKEFVARAIHLLSSRSQGPFIAVNCGAIPRDLLESELFGSEKGAYTGSVRTRAGLMENASGGTLFLDEIGDMPHDMQVKLLRVLEEQSFSRVGGSQTIRVDVRFVCATHRDLDALIAAQSFREDLYYRINVFPIQILPLDQRREDIPALVKLIIERFSAQGQLMLPRLSDGAIEALQALPWPGNVRQLRNVIERASILYPDQDVHAHDVPRLVRFFSKEERKLETQALWEAVSDFTVPLAPRFEPAASVMVALDYAALLRAESGFNLRDYMTEIESSFIRTALGACDGSVSAAARMLGTQRTTLIEKMRKFSIQREDA
jgi:sigma-54 dependent transcriptional regulator, flagellar regulatory protein